MKIVYDPDINIDADPLVPKKKTDKSLITAGLIWNSIQLLVNQSFAFIVKLILVKLLMPAEFGLVGMATVFTCLIQVINDLGVGAALVQRKEANLRESHFHTAFWTGVIWSIGLFAIMSLLVAPLAAYWYKQDALRLIIPVLSIGILSSPVNLIHKAQLTREMNFKKIAVIDNLSNIVSGCIAIALAFSGAGIWSLVFNSVATFIVAMPLYYKTTKWLPKFIWDKQAFKDVFGFGAYTTGANIFTYLYNNIDYLLIGKLLGASTLGIYTFAFVITDTFRSRIMAVINNVMYPIYGKKQNDLVSLKRYYLKVVLFNCVIIFPVMLFFIILGDSFVTQLFGAKWQGAIVPLQFLSFSVMFQMMVSGNTALIRGLGKPGLDMKLQIVKAILFVPTLAYGIVYYGILGASVAILINKFLLVVIAQIAFKYLLPVKISTIDLLKALQPCLTASLIAAVCCSLVHYYLSYGFIYGALALLIPYFSITWLLIGKELRAILKKN